MGRRSQLEHQVSVAQERIKKAPKDTPKDIIKLWEQELAWQCNLVASCHCRLEEIIVDNFLVCLHNRLLDTAVSIVRVLNLKTKTSSVSELIESKS